jgi:polar amino acid transport system ATP-binding protein
VPETAVIDEGTPAVPVLDIRGLSMSIGGTRVLSDITCQLQHGRTLSVVGPSGSGKSTLLRCLNRLERATAGTVLVNGTCTDSLPAKQLRSRVGLVSQRFALFGHLNVMSNVTLPLRRVRSMTKSVAEELAADWLDRVGLAGLERRRPHQLSGGQQQRVAIARAAALEPDVLLLDEVTSALDPELIDEVENVTLELSASGTTLIVVTHDIPFAAKVGDAMMMLEGGKAVEYGTPREVLSSSHPRSQRFFQRHLRGVTLDTDVLTSGR